MMNKEKMTIIGLEGCGSCSIIHDQFPNVKYIVVKKRCADDKACIETKKALSKFNIEHYPVVFNEDFSEILSLASLAE